MREVNLSTHATKFVSKKVIQVEVGIYIAANNITESVDSVCRDTTYTQYMLIQKNLSKSQKRYTYKPL